MHHFLYPTQDTFVTDIRGYENLNFGLNEILRVGVQDIVSKITLPTTEFTISGSVNGTCVSGFSGSAIVTPLYGTASFAVGSIYNDVSSSLDTSYFTGIVTASYLSASITGSITGSVTGFTGSLSGFFSGSISGSFLTDYAIFTGNLYGFVGKFIGGQIVGTEILNRSRIVTQNVAFSNRALLQFDLSAISASIVAGDITNPSFKLKVKSAREENVPIQYSVAVYPISESWVMGNGYFFDGGSSLGASWNFRDRKNGTPWTTTGSSFIPVPFAQQNFNYESGDISLDITNIVNTWLNQNIPNNGLVLISSEESDPTGSGMSLFFFSRDTNTIYSPYIDASWNDFSLDTGSIWTGSVNITKLPAGLLGTISDTPTITNSNASGSLFGTVDILVDANMSASGVVSAIGQTGTIAQAPIFGMASGSITQEIFVLTQSFAGFGPNFNISDFDFQLFVANFGYFPFVVTTTIITTPVTVSLFEATFINGDFSGSQFTASITNGVQIQGGLTGSWNTAHLLGGTISASAPFTNYPTIFATLFGDYIHGSIYGTLTNVSQSNINSYGIFNGSIFGGPQVGARVVLPWSGSFRSADFSYTSSIIMASSSLEPLNVNRPFVTVVKIPEKVKTNEIIRVNVFGREEFPLKNFQRLTQLSQFITPLYLPTSSFYAIKDNETEEIILDFDNYTRLSCDHNGSFFMLDTSGLPEERYFKILIKVEQSGSVYVKDHDDIFKVVR